MKETIFLLSEFVDFWHDMLWELSDSLGWGLTDKELHFWIVGILGVIGLLVVDVIFHFLARYSITAMSFLFSLAIVLVAVFALEIQQKIKGSGNMEFNDAVAGILGFLAFCIVYFIIKGIIEWSRRRKRKKTGRRSRRNGRTYRN
ncbi:hypothetical protein [Halobacillus salinus]|uniref:Uncharacterized protein n=1 Tax=Halobacillus salinus TaxID=192814 RepID=A0A4Z0GVB4_9BACI|nr:hypothetical protein [Halobacillus salinus]TGB01663.1 hypothetical protein E4663_16030 [Halobacillus salinus]